MKIIQYYFSLKTLRYYFGIFISFIFLCFTLYFTYISIERKKFFFKYIFSYFFLFKENIFLNFFFKLFIIFYLFFHTVEYWLNLTDNFSKYFYELVEYFDFEKKKDSVIDFFGYKRVLEKDFEDIGLNFLESFSKYPLTIIRISFIFILLNIFNSQFSGYLFFFIKIEKNLFFFIKISLILELIFFLIKFFIKNFYYYYLFFSKKKTNSFIFVFDSSNFFCNKYFMEICEKLKILNIWEIIQLDLKELTEENIKKLNKQEFYILVHSLKSNDVFEEKKNKSFYYKYNNHTFFPEMILNVARIKKEDKDFYLSYLILQKNLILKKMK